MLIRNCLLADCGGTFDVSIRDGRIARIADGGSLNADGQETLECGGGLTLLPAFVDIHTHLREPGYEAKETVATGTAAAVAGGYAAVCCMPNTNPVADNPCIVRYIVDRAREANSARVYPIGAITAGEKGLLMAEMGKMKQAGAVAVSDDGQPVTSAQMMRLALEYAADFDLPVISHCEDKSLCEEGVANEGVTASEIGLKGIPSAAEDVMIAREIILAEMLRTRVHIAHVSTRSGVQLIREAKARGVRVTCETCPHYIAGTEELIRGYNTAAKVNPPLRTEADRRAICAGLADGTIDAIATDHAPHAVWDKECEFNVAANGISGLETAFALCYTELVRGGVLTLTRLSELMTARPAQILGLPHGAIAEGAIADLTLVDTDCRYAIDARKFKSKGKNTPFDGREVYGRIAATLVEGVCKYTDEELL